MPLSPGYFDAIPAPDGLGDTVGVGGGGVGVGVGVELGVGDGEMDGAGVGVGVDNGGVAVGVAVGVVSPALVCADTVFENALLVDLFTARTLNQ